MNECIEKFTIVRNSKIYNKSCVENRFDFAGEELMLNTVTFGVSAVLFLAVRVLHQLAYEYQPENLKISKVILKNFYMNNLITGTDDAEELKQIKKRVGRIFLTSGFPI